METATDIGAEVWRGLASRIAKRGLNMAHALLRQNAISPYVGRTEAPRKSRGDATHWIDAEMRTQMSTIVGEETNYSALYVGEEENVPHNLKHRDFLARTDELDGTTNSLTLFGTFAIVVFIERVNRDEESVTHVAGAIAAATGEVTSWSRDPTGRDNVEIEWPGPFQWGDDDDVAHDEPEATAGAQKFGIRLEKDPDAQRSGSLRIGHPGRLAVNAAHRERRVLLAERMGEELANREDLWVSNCAGNPLIAPLLVGDLAAIYEPKSLQLHDAAFLVPLYLAGGSVRSPQGGRLDVLAHFQELGSSRQIGPFVAGTTGGVVDQIISGLSG